MDFLIDELSVSPVFLNLLKLNYNLVFGGSNKLVIRNKSPDTCRRLLESTYATLYDMINTADGVLINALNHPILMQSVVRRIHDENMRYSEKNSSREKDINQIINSEEYFSRPKHRKVVSVITPKLDRDLLIETIYPFTTTIHNREDLIRIFYGGSTSDLPEGDYRHELKAMAQMRYGIPTRHGFNRMVLDRNDNIYVTLGGSEGHLVAIEDRVYRVFLETEIDKEFGNVIKQNKSSRSGAGDAFAAGITRQETLRQARNLKKTGVVANSFVGYFLGFNRTIHDTDIVVEEIGSLSDHYVQEGLYRKI